MGETIQILELFGGIGSPRCALRIKKETGNTTRLYMTKQGTASQFQYLRAYSER